MYKTSYGARGIPPPFSDEDGYRETPVKDKPIRKTWFYPLVMADAVPIEGGSLRHPVEWKEQRLKQLPPGRYLLRLHLDKATAYSVSFK